jgi:CIC family chloride channel protein
MSKSSYPSERLRRLTTRLLRWGGRLLGTPEQQLTALAIVTGVVTGLGALAFSNLVGWFEWFYFDWLGGALHESGLYFWLLPLLPMSGALLVGMITFYFAPEAEGHGVPEVMDAMARKGGKIRPRVAAAKAIASALTIGSGGAAGTEGPIIQIGAAIGSSLGQWVRSSLNDVRVLIGCGAAAGIAAIFNAPIAGVLFSVEVLLRDVSLRNFVPIIIAAVLSNTVTHVFRGANEPLFPIPVEAQIFGVTANPVYEFSASEFGNYALLGVVCGFVAVGLVKLLYWSEDVFKLIPVHRIFKPVTGAFMLGVLAVASHLLIEGQIPNIHTTAGSRGESFSVEKVDTRGHPPEIMGNGYPVINQTLEPAAYVEQAKFPDVRPWAAGALILLLVGKILATCLTLGSGGSGGVFAPSLFVGATVGGAFGIIMQSTGFFPDLTPGAYALVGMAAVVAASIHAPLTATLILFELTRDYKVILPIMLTAVIGIAIAQRFERGSIYTLKLRRRGVRLASAEMMNLRRIAVRDLTLLPAPMVHPEQPVSDLVHRMRTSAANDFLVTDSDDRLVGMVLGDELRTMLLESEALPLLIVRDVMREDIPTVQLDETLDSVMDRFAGRPMHALPVLDPEDMTKASHLVTRVAVMNRHYQSLDQQ